MNFKDGEIELTESVTDGTDIITVQVRAKGGATTEVIIKVKYTSVENQNSVITAATVTDFLSP